MKTTLLLLAAIALASCNTSCANRADGTKTFGGLDAAQWGGVAVKTGSAYLDTKRQPVTYTNAKGVVEVQPAPAETSWLSMGMSLFGF